MKKITAAFALLLALTLTGCSAGSELTQAERDYLAVIKPVSDRPETALLDAGHEACEQILGGRDIFQVQVFDDDSNDEGFYADSVRVALAAAPRLCPNLD